MRPRSWIAGLWDAVMARLGGGEPSVDRDDLRRLGLLLAVCACCALLVVDYARAPDDALAPGDIAPRTVKAPFEFTYADHAEHERAQAVARQESLPVFVHRRDLLADRDARVVQAFQAGRDRLATMTSGGVVRSLGTERELLVLQDFLDPVRVQLRDRDLNALLEGGFSHRAEGLTRELLARAMKDQLIVLSRDQLPVDQRSLRLIQLEGGQLSEVVLTEFSSIQVPEEARQQISLGVLHANVAPSPEIDAAAELARSLVAANLSFDPLETEERRNQAANMVPLTLQRVQRGQILFGAGEVVTEADLDVYRALQSHRGEHDLPRELLAIGLFLLLLLGSLYHFAATYLQDFSTRMRDLAAAGGLLVLVAFIARVVVASSEGVAMMVGYEAEARSVWFFVPVAGAAMLVRLLLGVSWTLAFSVAAAAICGLVMDLQALPVVFFMISSVAAGSAIEHTRERIAVLKAGALVGIVNAITVLIIHFVQLFVVEGELSLATTMRPFWSMSFAFLGGMSGAFLVLGIVPLMESMGFVTDYRMMELANLNHPLLRKLMLRAPGSYHHSVVVGTLAEAGCEAIGANALSAKVASYFHDIGKAVKPKYFIENQRDEVSRHASLDPHASAQVIISHVIDGGRMAREHNLPQPIIDNIYMHHGTGVLQYFYARARELAEDPDEVDIRAFRYPGPKPSNREAGVIMLADKVEAATRTLQRPDAHNIRAMIHRIVNSVIADGQFSECPLNLQEIQIITDTFVAVLLGIHHQRIEYAETADISAAASSSATKVRTPPPAAMITLDLVPKPPRVSKRPQSSQETPTPSQARIPLPTATTPPAEVSDGGKDAKGDGVSVADYEAVDYLPRGE